MTGEAFKQNIDAKIDNAVNQSVESADEEKLENLSQKANYLRSSLKKSITLEHTEDERITETEWQEIFDSLPKELLMDFNINSKKELKEKEVKAITNEIITGGYEELSNFMEKTIDTLTPKNNGEVLYELALAGKLTNTSQYFEKVNLFKDSPLVSDIFICAGKSNIYQTFIQFDKIKKFPWAMKVLMEIAKYGDSRKVRKYLEEDSVDSLTEEDKQQIIKVVKKREKKMPILKKLLNQKQVKSKLKFKKSLNKLALDPALQKIDKIEDKWLPKTVKEEKDIYDSFPQVRFSKEAFEKWAETETDGNQEYYNNLLKHWKYYQDEYVTPSVSTNMKAMVARNLYFQKQAVNKENVKNEVKRIMETREKYKNIELFSGRNVIVAANLEVWSEKEKNGNPRPKEVIGKNRFGKKSLIDRIKKDGGKIKGVLRPTDNLKSLRETKQKILDSIKETSPPFTFLFQGHGDPNALYLSDGGLEGDNIKETNKTIKITTREFFQTYKTRQEKYKNETNTPQTRDIFINEGCFSANFIRSFYLMCEKKGIQKPIFGGESEYGQYAKSEYNSIYGNNFFDQIFDNKTKKATIGNIIENDSLNKNSNPSLYIPDNQNRTMQIS